MRDRDRADVILAHQRHRLGLAPRAPSSAVEQHAHEAPVVISGRGRAAAPIGAAMVSPSCGFCSSMAPSMRAPARCCCATARPLCLRHVVGRVIHLERAKMLAGNNPRAFARHHLDKLCRDVGAGAVVPALARSNRSGPPNGQVSPARGEIAPDLAGERIGQSGRASAS